MGPQRLFAAIRSECDERLTVPVEPACRHANGRSGDPTGRWQGPRIGLVDYRRRTPRNAEAYNPVPFSVDRPASSPIVGPLIVSRLDRNL